MTSQRTIGPDTLVGDILKRYPALRGKVLELFGPDCLACKSNQRETVTYTAWHKGLDPDAVVRELNAELRRK